MLKIWCMFDNHTFASVDATDRDGIRARASELIERKRGATFFVRDEMDSTLSNLNWHARDKLDGLTDWLDRVEIELSFRKMMVA